MGSGENGAQEWRGGGARGGGEEGRGRRETEGMMDQKKILALLIFLLLTLPSFCNFNILKDICISISLIERYSILKDKCISISLIGVTDYQNEFLHQNDSHIEKFAPIIKSVISVQKFLIHLYIMAGKKFKPRKKWCYILGGKKEQEKNGKNKKTVYFLARRWNFPE